MHTLAKTGFQTKVSGELVLTCIPIPKKKNTEIWLISFLVFSFNQFISTMPPRIPDLAKVRQLIPPLSHELHKGQAGIIYLNLTYKK